MAIKVVIFDWGDVLGFYDLSRFDSFLIANNCNTSTSDFFRKNKPNFDNGTLSEEQFWTKLKNYLHYKGTWKELATTNQNNLIINFNNLHIIKKIRKTKKTALLSNMDPTSVAKIKKEIKLEDYFDKYYFSYEIKQQKMNKTVLKKIISEFNVKPDEVLFIDDFKANIVKATDFGFKTIHYKNEKQLEKELNKKILN